MIEGPDDDCTVLRNGRQLRTGLTEAAARRFVRDRMGPTDKVLRAEADGFRVPVRPV